MADRDQIVSFLNELLDIGAYPDGMPVGMQVPGAAQVRRVATGRQRIAGAVPARRGRTGPTC